MLEIGFYNYDELVPFHYYSLFNWFSAKLTEEATKQAQKVGQTISQKSEEISKTQTYRTISDTAKAVKEEIDQSTFGGAGARVYKAPKVLRKRVERDPEAEKRIIQVPMTWSEMKSMNLYSCGLRFKV